MKKILVFTLVFITLESKAQPTLLWKIECDTCAKPSYLLGTAHYISGSYFFQHLALGNLILTVDAIATESGGTRAIAKFPVDSFFISTPLRNLFTAQQYRMFSDSFSRYLHASLDSFPFLSPLVVQIMIQKEKDKMFARANQQPVKRDSLIPLGMDDALEEMARERGIPLYALESPQQFVKQFFRLTPAKEQAARSFQDLIGKSPNAIDKCSDSCWKKNDLFCLCACDPEAFYYTGPCDSSFIYARNMNWIQVIPRWLGKKSVLIACGSLHLCGEAGIIDLLEKRGYRLTPLSYQ